MRFCIHPKPPVVNSLKSWRVANKIKFLKLVTIQKKKILN